MLPGILKQRFEDIRWKVSNLATVWFDFWKGWLYIKIRCIILRWIPSITHKGRRQSEGFVHVSCVEGYLSSCSTSFVRQGYTQTTCMKKYQMGIAPSSQTKNSISSLRHVSCELFESTKHIKTQPCSPFISTGLNEPSHLHCYIHSP